MTREEHEMRTLVRESDVIDRTDGSELAKAFNYLWEKYVEQEPKTGHWIWELEDWNKWICSECGWSKRTDVHVRLGYDFCPSCGAKMVEPQESEDNE